MHQVNPQFRPGGRKKLRDGLEAHDATLLFHQTDWFYRKKKAVLLMFFGGGGHPPHPPFSFKFNLFSIYKTQRRQKQQVVLVPVIENHNCLKTCWEQVEDEQE